MLTRDEETEKAVQAVIEWLTRYTPEQRAQILRRVWVVFHMGAPPSSAGNEVLEGRHH